MWIMTKKKSSPVSASKVQIFLEEVQKFRKCFKIWLKMGLLAPRNLEISFKKLKKLYHKKEKSPFPTLGWRGKTRSEGGIGGEEKNKVGREGIVEQEEEARGEKKRKGKEKKRNMKRIRKRMRRDRGCRHQPPPPPPPSSPHPSPSSPPSPPPPLPPPPPHTKLRDCTPTSPLPCLLFSFNPSFFSEAAFFPLIWSFHFLPRKKKENLGSFPLPLIWSVRTRCNNADIKAIIQYPTASVFNPIIYLPFVKDWKMS